MKQLSASLSGAVVLAVLSLMAGCQLYNPLARDEANLAGTVWVAEEIDGRDVINRAEPTVEFGSERITGSAGCNRYDASLSISGNKFRIGKAAIGRGTCNSELMGQELRFLAALAATSTYHAEGDSLRLVDEQDITRMRLARVLISLRGMLCSDGVKAVSIVMRPAGKNAIEVVMPDATRRLERVPGIISGTAFSDGHVGILSDGGKVMLETAGHRYMCSEK
jgi:heat shock protein HslJ